MSKYFSYFPKVPHDLTNVGQKVDLTNILRRFKFRSSVQDRSDVFYKYDIQAGERPDIIAEKYYGDAKYAWVILHFNNIIDPFFGWHLSQHDLESYIKGKYGSLASAQGTVHEYRQVLNEAIVKYDGTKIPKRTVVVDKTTYDGLGADKKESISKYDWEVEQNDARRTINILDKRYLSQLESEVEDILRNGV